MGDGLNGKLYFIEIMNFSFVYQFYCQFIRISSQNQLDQPH